MGEGEYKMTIDQFSEINKERCESLQGFNHKLESWSLSDWMTATLGELGEAANVVKKLNRLRDGIPNKETRGELEAALRDELADAFIYLNLLMQSVCGEGEVAETVMRKFNATSRKLGYPEQGRF